MSRERLSERSLRHELIADGTLSVERNQVRPTRDHLFSSPSTEESVVSGGVYNGREAWKDSNGVSLLEIREQTADA